MAVYRQIQITYWQDRFILGLTPEEKFFYVYLLTNSKTKQCGIYELPIKIIEIETGYNRETVLKLLQRFIEHKKIKYDWENEEIFLLNWVKHNPVSNENIEKCVIKELQDVHNLEMIPKESKLQEFLSPYQAPTKPLPSNKNKNKNKNKNNSEEIIMIGEREIIIKEYFVDLLPVTLTQQEIEAWVGWVDYRKDVKKKLTKRSAEMQIQFLLKQPDLVKCIGQSIQNQWQGLFEVKDGITKRSNKEITPERIASDLSKAF